MHTITRGPRGSRPGILTRSSLLVLFLLSVLSGGGCQKKLISYVEMIEREDAEIADFFNKNGLTEVADFPSGLVTPEKVFVKVDDGFYVRVVKAGTKEPVNAKTYVSARFNLESISPRVAFEQILYGPKSGGTSPLPFVYFDSSETLQLAPKASQDETLNQPLLCQALLRAVKLAGGDGAEVQIITSFRYGPSLMSQDGIPLYFSTVHFTFLN